LTTKSGRKLGKKTLKMGGIAAVGALAYAAYQRYSSSNQNAGSLSAAAPEATIPSAPPGSAFLPADNDVAAQNNLALILVRAMIAAARSDGQLDAQESQAIFQRIESLGLEPDEQALLVAEMGRPVDMDAIVNSATSPETAAEIYLASLLAVDVDTPAERAYLSMLSARLQLPPELVSELHRQVEAQQEPV
jgi:uncharacterized membrane protein YebE (DUF533 family)